MSVWELQAYDKLSWKQLTFSEAIFKNTEIEEHTKIQKLDFCGKRSEEACEKYDKLWIKKKSLIYEPW